MSPRTAKPSGTPVPWSALSRELVDEELARLAESREFRRNPRHVRLLRHLIRRTIEGDHARLREIVLGVEVFHRNAARFDPRSDTIVRVEVRRLRQKLARYYAEEGITARLQFELPVRSYAVEVHWRLGAAGVGRKASLGRGAAPRWLPAPMTARSSTVAGARSPMPSRASTGCVS